MGSGSAREGRRRPAFPRLRRAAWVALAIAGIGEAGHQILDRFGDDLAHHFFHIAFGVGAFVIFTAYVARDIHRHGRPAFSWRLRSAARGPS